MNKNVIISVRGIQTTGNRVINTLELVTEGKYYKKGNTYYVTYKESKVTGMEGTTTTLKIGEDGVVTLMRFGSVNTQFIFEQGQKHVSYYDTKYGTFTVGVTTNVVLVDVDDEGGEVRVDYELDIDDNKSGQNDFHMFIREVGQLDGKYSGEHKETN
ncbi:MAG TPA: DUF1934 domain-containing protein [Ruminiclostridium sp.]|jgi:uncharacterized beta-barrel protein YwiB (DUF1934 family)|uniref:Putative beta-barrel protein YwiB n=1 Tax=Acetivibrio saccincola TaxID=1677857 RepID=A0A2K9E1R8_9FIRM|nr:DUF1934 domain-containing protein [Acetivibrio saccincola]HAA43635.1 DUF1934 domain-containing protein [Ruminiclostridium sp.]AUG56318.1 putative beta-barrel protein YwiB [Acetivibrio saccincola]NLW26988.1 DUF1934 domain-containing protein [Acetivibrio saccincola]PQQ65482.1 hypothetical protein B9R14_01005 [Acetivibrio saccincola]HOA96854.1 DUF1934 domain-containing protein [Acetivibrio saccincola]